MAIKKLIILLVLIIGVFMEDALAQKKSKKDFVITLTTRLGDITLILFDETPFHKENFIKLAKTGFYNESTFHRVLKNFMIQGGDPNSKPEGKHDEIGRGGPGYTLPAEFKSHLKHDRGMLAAARMGDNVNPEKASSGSQFYIVQSTRGAHHLDGGYTIFGKVVKGMEVVDAIADQPVNQMGMPENEIRMTVTVEEMKKKEITEIYGYSYEEEKS